MTDPTDADRDLLLTITAAVDEPERFVQLLYAYYHDLDRAERTPRGLIYLHLGQACGVIGRLLAARSLRDLITSIDTGADIPELYDVAKQVAHAHGFPWVDPRTGDVHPPPDKG